MIQTRETKTSDPNFDALWRSVLDGKCTISDLELQLLREIEGWEKVKTKLREDMARYARACRRALEEVSSCDEEIHRYESLRVLLLEKIAEVSPTIEIRASSTVEVVSVKIPVGEVLS